MKKVLMAMFLSVMALGLTAGDAEARRLGGGKTFGMQRQAVQPAPTRPTQQAAPASTGSTAAAAAPKRSWMGPIAGLAAGIGLAALFSHLGLGAEMANIVMIGLLLMAALFLFRLLFRRNASTAQDPHGPGMRYAGAGNVPNGTLRAATEMPFGSASSASTPAPSSVPADFDADAFLRVAKLNFVRLQAANDAKNIDDIREFTSPEMFAEIRMQMTERGEAAQQTDVVRLDAELLEAATEGDRHVVSVRFSGLIREEAEGPAAPFNEVWHLSKPVAGDKGWVVAGIQQAD